MGVNLVIDNFLYVASESNWDHYFNMEILYFEYLGNTKCRLAASAVVLVLGEYQISRTRIMLYGQTSRVRDSGCAGGRGFAARLGQ